MLYKIYGIDYDVYVCGGVKNMKLARYNRETVIFENEAEMLKKLAEIKEKYYIDNITIFESTINRKEYKL